MNLMQMIQSGDVVNLAIMAGLFIMTGIMISAVGKGIAARDAQAALPAGQAEQRTGNNSAVTAAISAAVNTYRKNK